MEQEVQLIQQNFVQYEDRETEYSTMHDDDSEQNDSILDQGYQNRSLPNSPLRYQNESSNNIQNWTRPYLREYEESQQKNGDQEIVSEKAKNQPSQYNANYPMHSQKSVEEQKQPRDLSIQPEQILQQSPIILSKQTESIKSKMLQRPQKQNQNRQKIPSNMQKQNQPNLHQEEVKEQGLKQPLNVRTIAQEIICEQKHSHSDSKEDGSRITRNLQAKSVLIIKSPIIKQIGKTKSALNNIFQHVFSVLKLLMEDTLEKLLLLIKQKQLKSSTNNDTKQEVVVINLTRIENMKVFQDFSNKVNKNFLKKYIITINKATNQITFKRNKNQTLIKKSDQKIKNYPQKSSKKDNKFQQKKTNNIFQEQTQKKMKQQLNEQNKKDPNNYLSIKQTGFIMQVLRIIAEKNQMNIDLSCVKNYLLEKLTGKKNLEISSLEVTRKNCLEIIYHKVIQSFIENIQRNIEKMFDDSESVRRYFDQTFLQEMKCLDQRMAEKFSQIWKKLVNEEDDFCIKEKKQQKEQKKRQKKEQKKRQQEQQQKPQQSF